MPGEVGDDGNPAVGIRATYDAVAAAYDAEFADELEAKPLDRALLTAFADLVGSGLICDIGCGPGHITRFLAHRHAEIIGLDLSPAMIEIARRHAPGLSFTVGSMLNLPVADNAWAGAVSLYSIIHLTPSERSAACHEFARVVRPGGWLLLAFHVDSPEFAVGAVNHLTSWFGECVELDGYFLEPDDVVAQLVAAGFTLKARLEREPLDGVEYPSRRCYLLAQR
ncbi:class I SAM-dependent methyltransferase [Mycobacterium sp. B14F4]|uniref:class I SAM-dependent methyltransferase n=1 Tax=Mycobacterium sp. B14F4 TaxID=3153565 RepID=UPI00325E9054